MKPMLLLLGFIVVLDNFIESPQEPGKMKEKRTNKSEGLSKG
jgi:hypothetical protein